MSPPSLPLGTIVIHKSRAYRFCGVTPVSIQPTMALLKDLHTGFLTEVPFTEIQPRRTNSSRRRFDDSERSGPNSASRAAQTRGGSFE